jgi:LysM repeat protein
MAGRSPVRFLAPLALVAVVIALLLVINSSMKDTDTGNGSRSQSSGQPKASPTGKAGKKNKKNNRSPRRYTIKNGDTPSSIAEKTGVPLADILRLNPDLDPQTLAPGQRIKLRQ